MKKIFTVTLALLILVFSSTLIFHVQGQDPLEPDNSFTEYSSITVEIGLSWIQRSIDPAGDEDYMRFYASSSNKYIFYTEGITDTVGYLYDSSHNQLAYDDDSGTDTNFRIEYTITATAYYFLRVRGYSSNTQGYYRLYLIYEAPTDSFEPDNSFTQYSTMTVTATLASQSRTIIPGGDEDYIRFLANSGRKYILYTDGETNTMGYLYDSSHNQLAYDDDSGTDTNFRIEYTINADGFYFLRVTGFNSYFIGWYVLYYQYLTVVPPGDSFEPDDSFTEFSTITVATTPASQSRSIDPAGDEDYIRFLANSGRKYIFYTDGETDTVGYLYDSTHDQLAYDDDSGISPHNFRIEYTITANGYYFLRVTGWQSDTQGPYILYYQYVTYVPPGDSFEPDNSFTQYSTMTVATTTASQSRSIDPAGDEDHIRFYASSGNKYVFYTESSVDTKGYLYDSSESELAYDDDSGTDTNFRIEYTITATAYYFLKVQGYSSSTQGPYTLYYQYSQTQTDTTPPSVSMNKPVDGASFSTSTVTFNVSASDPESGISKVELYIDEQLEGDMTSAESDTFTRIVSGLAEGQCSWFAKAYNGAGLEASTATRTLTITTPVTDTTPPSVSMNKPVDGASFSTSTVTFNLSANDAESGISKVELYLDDQLRGNMNLGSQNTFALIVSNLVDGDHTWYAKVYNGAGLAATTSERSFTVQLGSEPQPGSLDFTPLYFAGGAFLGVAGLVGIAYVLTRKKSHPTPSTTPEITAAPTGPEIEKYRDYLQKLEGRFKQGQISSETYQKLKAEYESKLKG